MVEHSPHAPHYPVSPPPPPIQAPTKPLQPNGPSRVAATARRHPPSSHQRRVLRPRRHRLLRCAGTAGRRRILCDAAAAGCSVAGAAGSRRLTAFQSA